MKKKKQSKDENISNSPTQMDALNSNVVNSKPNGTSDNSRPSNSPDLDTFGGPDNDPDKNKSESQPPRGNGADSQATGVRAVQPAVDDVLSPVDTVKTFDDPSGGGKMTLGTYGGRRTYSPSCYLLADELCSDLDIQVSVPVSVSAHYLIYSIREQVDHFSEHATDLSNEVLENICDYIYRFREWIGLQQLYVREADAASSSGAVDPTTDVDLITNLTRVKVGDRESAKYLEAGTRAQALVDALRAANFSNPEINEIISAAISNVDRFLIRNTLSPSVMRHALERSIYDAAAITDLLTQLNVSSIEEAVRNAQDLYAFAATTKVLDAFGEKIQQTVVTSSSLATAFELFKIFANYKGPSVTLRLNRVLESTLQGIGFDTVVVQPIEGNRLFAQIERVPDEFLLEKVTRLDIMRFRLATCYFFMRRSQSVRDAYFELASNRSTMDQYREVLMRFSYDQSTRILFPGDLDVWSMFPSHQAEALTEDRTQETFDVLVALFKRVFTRRLLTLLLTNDPGFFATRIRGLIDERALERSETWDYVVEGSLKSISVYFQAFLDASSYMDALVYEEDLQFLGDHALITPKLLEHYQKITGELDVSVLPSSHPASISEGSLIVRNAWRPQAFSAYKSSFDQFFFSYDIWRRDDQNQTVIYEPVSDTYRQYLLADITTGSWLDLPLQFPKSVYLNHLYRGLNVQRFITLPFQNDLLTSSPLGEFILRHPRMDSLSSYHLDHVLIGEGRGAFAYFSSPEEVMLAFQIDYSEAQILYSRAPKMPNSSVAIIYTYIGPLVCTTLLPDSFKVYERVDRSPSDGVPSQLIEWPVSASREYKGVLATYFGGLAPSLVTTSEDHSDAD